MPSPFICMLYLYDLYKNDEVLSDAQTDTWTTDKKRQRTSANPDSEYELYSDRMTRVFPGLVLNDRQILNAGPGTPTLNYKQLKSLLLSKDLGRNREFDWLQGRNFRFLDGEDLGDNQVAFVSAPRSGNSFLRCFLEEITGVLTGADLNINW